MGLQASTERGEGRPYGVHQLLVPYRWRLQCGQIDRQFGKPSGAVDFGNSTTPPPRPAVQRSAEREVGFVLQGNRDNGDAAQEAGSREPAFLIQRQTGADQNSISLLR